MPPAQILVSNNIFKKSIYDIGDLDPNGPLLKEKEQDLPWYDYYKHDRH
jgi:hypothetical protein